MVIVYGHRLFIYLFLIFLTFVSLDADRIPPLGCFYFYIFIHLLYNLFLFHNQNKRKKKWKLTSQIDVSGTVSMLGLPVGKHEDFWFYSQIEIVWFSVSERIYHVLPAKPFYRPSPPVFSHSFHWTPVIVRQSTELVKRILWFTVLKNTFIHQVWSHESRLYKENKEDRGP